MKRLLLLCLTGALLSIPFQTQAQTRRRAPQRRAPRATTTAAPLTETELRDGRERLTAQIKLLSRFLYLYGRISGTVEATERAQGGRQAAQPSRAALVENFRNVRGGLDDLAARFRASRTLVRYSPQVTEASALAAQASGSLTAGNLDEAGKSLVAAVGSLTDALAGMR